MHGMNEIQAKLASKVYLAVREVPFTIGDACDKAGADVKLLEAEFPKLCVLGVLRCPVNDGGMALYQFYPGYAADAKA